jgi:ABC-type transport system involved in multi-copper enzyme maturation permease subunit
MAVVSVRERVNPIITREMRSRMRGGRSFVVLTISAGLLSLLAASIYASIYYQNLNSSYPMPVVTSVNNSATIGTAIFVGTFLLLLAIFSFVAPAFGAAALAGEQERQTYETLLITSLRPGQIVWGKLGAIGVLLLLFLLISLPIQSLAFAFGGVTPAEGLIGAGGLLATALTLSALGLYMSSMTRTTTVAVMISYGVIIPFIYGLPLIFLFLFEGPFYWVADFFENDTLLSKIILFYVIGFILCISPFSAAALSYYYIVERQQGYFFFTVTEQIHTSTSLLSPTTPVTFLLISPWLVYLVFHILFSLFLVRLTIRRVGRMSER